MSNDSVQLEGPDFKGGVYFSSIADGAMLNGRVSDQAVLAVWRVMKMHAGSHVHAHGMFAAAAAD